MYIAKAIILLITFVFANEGSFRGKNLNEILNSSIPISYANYIAEQYNIPISQLNAQRGSYLILSLIHISEPTRPY